MIVLRSPEFKSPPTLPVTVLMPWPVIHRLDITLPTAAANVALDEALLVEAEDQGGPAVVRTWELDHFAVVLGASCRIKENVEIDACRADRIEIARRSSGGGTVVIGPGALNFSVILPIDAAPELRGIESAQSFVLGRVRDAIARAGISAELLGSADLTLGDRKFSGSSQRRLRRHLLIHASLLNHFPLERIDRYLKMPPRRPAYRRDRPHSDFVTNLGLTGPRLIAAIHDAWLPTEQSVIDAKIPESTFRTLLETKFSGIAWIERL